MKAKVNNIGLNVKPPEKVCNDIKCPWHGKLKVRGKIFIGTVVKKYQKTVTIEIPYLKYVPKYERYMRCISKIHSYLPECIDVNIGDKVIAVETRKLSKTKASVVVAKV